MLCLVIKVSLRLFAYFHWRNSLEKCFKYWRLEWTTRQRHFLDNSSVVWNKCVACVAGGLFARAKGLRRSRHSARKTACRISWGFLMPPTFSTFVDLIKTANQSEGVKRALSINVFRGVQKRRKDYSKILSFPLGDFSAASAPFLLRLRRQDFWPARTKPPATQANNCVNGRCFFASFSFNAFSSVHFHCPMLSWEMNGRCFFANFSFNAFSSVHFHCPMLSVI